MSLFILLSAYLAICFIHYLVYSGKDPEITSYFKPGEEFYSAAEGFRQRVIKQENGYVYCSLQVDPYAPGPPAHIHSEFDEFVEIHNGELSVWMDGEVKKLKPGEKILIPKGTPHKPFNETADTIRLKGHVAFPEKFAYHLVQVYGYMDHHPDFATSGKTMLQMTVFNTAGFDSYTSDGPPVRIQKIVGFLVSPISRVFGFKSYYPEYDIHRQRG